MAGMVRQTQNQGALRRPKCRGTWGGGAGAGLLTVRALHTHTVKHQGKKGLPLIDIVKEKIHYCFPNVFSSGHYLNSFYKEKKNRFLR